MEPFDEGAARIKAERCYHTRPGAELPGAWTGGGRYVITYSKRAGAVEDEPAALEESDGENEPFEDVHAGAKLRSSRIFRVEPDMWFRRKEYRVGRGMGREQKLLKQLTVRCPSCHRAEA